MLSDLPLLYGGTYDLDLNSCIGGSCMDQPDCNFQRL